MSSRELCICGSGLARKQFSYYFDVLRCGRCGSSVFVQRPGRVARDFEYSATTDKYAQEGYLRGKQLRWAHRKLLERDWAGKKVLEIGCFNGFFLDELRTAGASVFGFDVNRSAVAVGRDLFGLGERLQTSLEKLEACGPFDDIVCIDVLEHLDHPEDLLPSLTGMLMTGGQLVVAGPTVERLFHDKSDFPPHHKWWFSRSGLTTFLHQNGYEITASEVQRDGFLLLRNFIGKVIYGLQRREFYGDNHVSAPAFVDGPAVASIQEWLNPVVDRMFRILGISYCSTLIIARKTG